MINNYIRINPDCIRRPGKSILQVNQAIYRISCFHYFLTKGRAKYLINRLIFTFLINGYCQARTFMQTLIHYFLHLGFPLVIAFVFFRKEWKKVYLIFLATMLVDLDHLLADPVFQANRCSINFHPLHTYYAMLGYALLLFFPRPFNIVGIGLLFHMLTDYIDCLMMAQ